MCLACHQKIVFDCVESLAGGISNVQRSSWRIWTRLFRCFDKKSCLTKFTFLRSMKRSTFRSAFFNPRVLGALFLCAAGGYSMLTGTLLAFFHPDALTKNAKRTLTFEERVVYQRLIEEVYWRHRIWPKENSHPKPSLD